MRAFRFRLEKVLQLRRQFEEEKRRELSLMFFDLRQLEAKLHSLRRELQSCKDEMTRDLEERDVSMARIEVFAMYIKRVTASIDSQLELISEIQKRIETKKKDLLEAIKARKAMESVKAKRQAQHHAAYIREEMKFLDEIGVARQLTIEHHEGFGG